MDRSIQRNREETLTDARGDALEYLTFPALTETGIVNHLFTTRLGGVSKGVFSTMNLSDTRGDEPEAVAENFKRIAKVMACKPEDMVVSKQTHTTNIRVVTKQDAGKGVAFSRDYDEVDGLVTKEKGIALVTLYADCVPLFFVDTKKHVIGLSHSGWRGTVSRMALRTIEKMTECFGSEPQDITAAIGPSICASCYEVSEDVILQFKQTFPEQGEQPLYQKKENGKYLLDLWEANRRVMREAGIPKAQISVTDLCTCCNPDYLFSHRATGGKRGNMAAVLMLK